jgi:hypothetical protein
MGILFFVNRDVIQSCKKAMFAKEFFKHRPTSRRLFFKLVWEQNRFSLRTAQARNSVTSCLFFINFAAGNNLVVNVNRCR